ncbi:MAG: hypothetical protein ABIP42_11550 [Planctomycetota bacterium]
MASKAGNSCPAPTPGVGMDERQFSLRGKVTTVDKCGMIGLTVADFAIEVRVD